MTVEYLVKKQFALNSDIYNAGDVVEMSEADAKSFVEGGQLEVHKEEKSVNIEVDTKSITEAIEAGFQKFAPKAAEKAEKKMTYGEYLQGVAKKTVDVKSVNISTGTQGGNATDTIVDDDIDVDLIQSSSVSSRVRMLSLSGNNNIYKKNIVDSLGTAPGITAEGVASTVSQPTIKTLTFTLEKLTYAFKATEEALEDAAALVDEVRFEVPEHFAKVLEDGIINGDGGELEGIVDHAETVSVAPEAGQTAALVAENIDKMYVSAKSPAKSVWIMSRSAYAAVQGLESSQGERLFQGPAGLGATVFGNLKGLPILVSDYCAAVGTAGDILLADLSRFMLVTKGGMKMASSAHVDFLEGLTTFRFSYRVAGQPVGLKLNAGDGTEIGDFVQLSDRISA